MSVENADDAGTRAESRPDGPSPATELGVTAEGQIRRKGPVAGLCTLLERVSRVLLLFMALSFSYEAVARYFFNSPTGWVNQLGAYLTASIAALCLGKCLLEQEQIRVDVFVERLRGRLRSAAEFTNEILGLAVGAMLAWAAYAAVDLERAIGVQVQMVGRSVPEWMLMIVLLVGLGGLVLAQLSLLMSRVRSRRAGSRASSQPSEEEVASHAG